MFDDLDIFSEEKWGSEVQYWQVLCNVYIVRRAHEAWIYLLGNYFYWTLYIGIDIGWMVEHYKTQMELEEIQEERRMEGWR